MAGFRITGSLTFNAGQRRNSAQNRWAQQATQRGWAGTLTPVGSTALTFDYSKTEVSPAEEQALAETAYNFCHDNGMTGGHMSVETLP